MAIICGDTVRSDTAPANVSEALLISVIDVIRSTDLALFPDPNVVIAGDTVVSRVTAEVLAVSPRILATGRYRR